MPTPQITALKIKNFGCIGAQGISIDIDKIVILVGANNAGKSTILRAFEVVADSLKLNEDEFHNRIVSPENLPEIEVHSIATDENKPGENWCTVLGDGKYLIKEKWTWTNVNAEPKRIGFNINHGRWAIAADGETMPWGANNVAKSRRPKPHRVNTFDNPEVQAKAITSLLKTVLEENIKTLKQNEDDELSRYDTIVQNLITLRNESKISQQASVVVIQEQANQILEKIFPNHELKIISPESTAPIAIDLLGEEFDIEMGLIDGVSLPLEKQGSGTRRTALWTILKLLADKGVRARPASGKAKTLHEPVGPNTAHILLLDEPEVSLHPKAIQNARDVLYSLPDNENWQVMITTHSPSFIDLSKDHTTIIRVEKNAQDHIEATTLFRPSQAQLDEDDKENLKLINLFDSHVSDAFFGGNILVVEGDTEYAAFNYIKQKELEIGNNDYHDLNIIRARGKVTVASMMKILNHFQARYYVLHDTDRQRTKSKVKDRAASINGTTVYRITDIRNPAWTNNEKILNQMSANSRVIASIVNFEEAYFAEVVDSEKPENCINHLKSEPAAFNITKQLLDGILELNGVQLPNGAVAWTSIEEIDQRVTDWDAAIVIQA